MKITALKTFKFLPPKDDLFALMEAAFSKFSLKNGSIVAVASKIVAISQGRCILVSDVKDKDDLIAKEADFYLERKETPNKIAMLTIKNNVLLPTAGIDESNANGYYILWPNSIQKTAKKIALFLRNKFHLKKLGVIITDSHSIILRRGTIGICIGFYGFEPLNDYRGQPDIFARQLKITQANVADALAVLSVLSMGEGKEQTPIAVIEDIDFINFTDKYYSEKNNPILVPREEDIYKPLLDGPKWRKR